MKDNQKQNNWQSYQVQTGSAPLIDAGTGKPYILRTFEFFINPKTARELKEKKIVPSTQELFNSHWPQIRTILWSDGLVANQDINPRIVIGKKRYRIFILCEPKFRTIVADRPKTLQEIFKKDLTN